MPRIREVKPEFFLDEQLAEVCHAARLLFIGLWTLCDREGRLEDRPARIKAQVFPYGTEDAETLLAELARGGFVIRYTVEGRAYLQVRSFVKHQRPHPKETASKFPPCPAMEENGKPGNYTASPETSAKQDDPSGGSMGTWAHGRMGDGVPSIPANPLIRGRRPDMEREGYRLIREINALEPERDPTEILIEAARWEMKDGRSRTKVRLETMTDDHLIRTVHDLKSTLETVRQEHGTPAPGDRPVQRPA